MEYLAFILLIYLAVVVVVAARWSQAGSLFPYSVNILEFYAW